ncbi:MAG: hypothetical protein QMB75_02735 [Thauera sp.]
MKDWQDFPDDDELERADDLLGQADALLRRHRGDTAPSSPGTQRTTDRDAAEPVHATPSGAAMQAFDDDDLPILTEVVDDLDLPTEIFQPTESSLVAAAAAQPAFVRSLAPGEVSHARAPAAPPEPVDTFAQPAAPSPPPPPSVAAAEQQLAERLVELDTAIAREIDEWAARELPQIIARELDRLGERIQDEALAHLRATLLPEISARVSSLFEDRRPDHPPGR